MVDGVCLSYDDNPIQMDTKLVKRLILSSVLAFDNLLDGFGLTPVLREAYGDGWSLIMICFSGCVLFGAALTAVLRYYVEDPLFHLLWFTLATVSILDGSLELASHGLTIYVALGMSIVWVVLVVGEMADDVPEDKEGEGQARGEDEARELKIRAPSADAETPRSPGEGQPNGTSLRISKA